MSYGLKIILKDCEENVKMIHYQVERNVGETYLKGTGYNLCHPVHLHPDEAVRTNRGEDDTLPGRE